MENAKLDTSLNLALELSPSMREDTEDLNVGYDEETRRWELIVRYHGDISGIAQDLEASSVILSGGYAIVTIAQDKIERLSEYEEIEFIEKPKRLEFSVIDGIADSCILEVQRGTNGLFGADVICAVIDSGVDFTHPDFRKEDGTTRILAYWDQSVQGIPPKGFVRGSLFTEQQLNALLLNTALSEDDLQSGSEIRPSPDSSGHGTHVAGICAGNGRASNGRYRGVAPESALVVVKLGDTIGNSFPKTTNLMEALQFVIDFSIFEEKPVAVNISFGNSYGSHSGRSLLETFIDEISAIGRSVICIGTGNEAGAGRHYSSILNSREEQLVEFAVSPYESSMNLQVWKNYFDEFTIELVSPSGSISSVIGREPGSQEFILDGTRILAYFGEPRPYNSLQEIYIDFLPVNQFIREGIWKVRIRTERIVDGFFGMWIPGGASINAQTRFLRPVEQTTLTIPSTAPRAITVGAYDSNTDAYAFFSGRGYTWENQWIKPELVAPGVDIISAAPGGSYTSRSGTSMATPFVTGSAALLMEWGIIRGNDPYLYGQKVKAYLIKGARQLPGYTETPNPQTGYGALCLYESIPLGGLQNENI